MDEQAPAAVRALRRHRARSAARALTRLGVHGDFGRPATQGAVEAAVLDLLGG